MTPVEWQSHLETSESLQRRRDQFLDYHFSRVCAYVRNWAGRTADKWVEDPIELMVNRPKQQQPVENDPAKASLFLMSLWDAVAPHLK